MTPPVKTQGCSKSKNREGERVRPWRAGLANQCVQRGIHIGTNGMAAGWRKQG
jgi:hypothetical protein